MPCECNMKPYFFHTPKLMMRLFGAFTWSVDTNDKEIYMTFDDGPHPIATPFVVQTLKKYNIKATFFIVGENAMRYRDIVQAITEDQHTLGNHTYHHCDGWRTNSRKYLNDIFRCEEVIERLTGTGCTFFRPPFGRMNPFALSETRKKYEIVMWSHLSGDFDAELEVDYSKSILNEADPGSIILFHDNAKSYTNLKKLLPRFIEIKLEAGYSFKSLQAHD